MHWQPTLQPFRKYGGAFSIPELMPPVQTADIHSKSGSSPGTIGAEELPIQAAACLRRKLPVQTAKLPLYLPLL